MNNFELPSRFSRWVASWIDFIILIVISSFMAVMITHFYPYNDRINFIGGLIMWLAFSCKDAICSGQSFGKRCFKMRVVDVRTSAPCKYGKSILRNFIFLLPCFTLIDVLCALINRKKRRLGDIIANTLVVKGDPPEDEGLRSRGHLKIFLVGLLISGALGASGYGLHSLATKIPHDYNSADRLSQLTAPTNWHMSKTSIDSVLEIFDPREENGVMIITESKEEIGYVSFSIFAEEAIAYLSSNLSQPVTVSDPIRMTINGRPAIQYEIRGGVDGDRFIYLHTSVEGERHFHQVIGLSVLSEPPDELQRIIRSFRENPL